MEDRHGHEMAAAAAVWYKPSLRSNRSELSSKLRKSMISPRVCFSFVCTYSLSIRYRTIHFVVWDFI